MAPEGCPPGLVKLFYVVVKFVFKVLCKLLLTQRTEALAAHLVGDVPHKQGRVTGKTLCQQGVDFFKPAAEVFAAHAVVVAVAVVVAYAHIVHTQTVRIFSVQPGRLCT